MSKQGKRKITVELPKSKDFNNRPSVFERLGTKKSGAKKTTEFCRQWSQNGTCAYGKSCKFASTHILISPSKQRAAKDNNGQKKLSAEDAKNRLHSTVVVRPGRSPDGDNIDDNWDQNDLEYADTDVLEKRRQQLQRELELQLKMDGKDMRKEKKKPLSSSSSSRSSSSSSFSSSSSDNSSSSSSTGRDVRTRGKKKLKRSFSSSSEGNGPAKKKALKLGSSKRDKNVKKPMKKDDKILKKQDSKKKLLPKSSLSKKSLSPGKKSGGTPPISSKSISKVPKSKSPARKNRSVSPRDKVRDRKEKDKEREKDRDKDKDKNRARSRSQTARSRSQRRHGSNPKDTRKKESAERSRPISPKKARKDGSTDKHKKRSVSRERDRGREHKDKSLERKKDVKHDDKDRHDKKDNRGRDRNKDTKRDDGKHRNRGGGGGLGRNSDKGLEKPNKPMERLLPRPEERLAALAAITNKNLDSGKNTPTKDRQDTHSDRGVRKLDREQDRSNKRERVSSVDREPPDYNTSERPYNRSHSLERYKRGDERYSDVGREVDRSPGYARDRHYDPNFEMSGPSRGYPEDDDRMFGDHAPEHRGEVGYEERRNRDRSWEGGRAGSVEQERGYGHPHKEWDGEDYRAGGDWNRDRHWPGHDAQMNEWGDKEPEEGWHHRGPAPGPQRGRPHGEYNRGKKVDNKWRGQKAEPEVPKEPPAAAPAPQPPPPPPRQEPDLEDKPIPDDLSEISDDPDDILNMDDMGDQNEPAPEVEAATEKPPEEVIKTEDIEVATTAQEANTAEEKDSKDGEENTNLDFEEISDGELEEERARGLGDALGVDWASLVADVRRREQPATMSGGARDRWRPERVLARLGLSVQMAGKHTVTTILKQHALLEIEKQTQPQNGDDVKDDGINNEENVEVSDVDNLHPVAVMQVAAERRKRKRAALFGVGCEITRALSARRDLALRRHLCRLPPTDRTPTTRATPQPELFQATCALLQAPVSG